MAKRELSAAPSASKRGLETKQERGISSLLIDAIDNVDYARNISLKHIHDFTDQILDGKITDDGERDALAITLFATDMNSRLAKAKHAIELAREIEGRRKGGAA